MGLTFDHRRRGNVRGEDGWGRKISSNSVPRRGPLYSSDFPEEGNAMTTNPTVNPPRPVFIGGFDGAHAFLTPPL